MGDKGVIKLLTAADSLQAGMIIEALGNSQIAAYKKETGVSSMMNIYSGNSKYGTDIMISETDLDRAMEVLQGMGIDQQ